MNAPGVLVTVEGIGGSGKSTLARNLAEALATDGYPVISSREPGATSLGIELRRLLLDPTSPTVRWAEAFLFEADRAQTYDELIHPAIMRGEIVVSDRNLYGTIAYQGFGRELDLDLIDSMTAAATRGLYPDMIFVVDIEPKIGLTRKLGQDEADRFDREKLDFQDRVREGYLFAASRDAGRAFVLDGQKAPEEVLTEALRLLRPLLEQKGLDKSRSVR